VDPILIFAQLTLSVLGIVGVATAAPGEWTTQALRAVLGLAIAVFIARISPRQVVKLSPVAYLSVLALLIVVLIIGASPQGSDSRRWLLIGNFSLQPSELMKVVVIAYLTAFFYNHLGNWQLWRPMLVIGLAAGAIVAEPDISTAAFIFLLALAIMLAAGTTLTRLFSITAASVLIAVLVAGPYLSQYSYIGERITGFRDLMGPQEQTQTLSYQALQAQRTLVRAGLFGIGPGRPMSVPAAETDMIAISVAQALGLVGIGTLFAMYLLIASRGIRIASALSGPGSLLAAGATTYICSQAALNLLVASGLLPVTGIPLPFVSYGLNSLISVSIAMGFIHSAYKQAQAEGAEL
jgi:cell division protein FtsW